MEDAPMYIPHTISCRDTIVTSQHRNVPHSTVDTSSLPQGCEKNEQTWYYMIVVSSSDGRWTYLRCMGDHEYPSPGSQQGSVGAPP